MPDRLAHHAEGSHSAPRARHSPGVGPPTRRHPQAHSPARVLLTRPQAGRWHGRPTAHRSTHGHEMAATGGGQPCSA